MNKDHTSMQGPGIVRSLVGASILAAVAAACEGSTPPSKSAADRATFMERTRCTGDDDDKALAPVLTGNAVTGVQPLYSAAGTARSGQQAELRGVTLSIVALQGVTPEWLDRALECHSARSTLGHGATPDDPFFVPDTSVDIDVRSAKDGFDVAVTGFSPEDAQKILGRANAFMKGKAAPTPAPK